LKKANSVAKSKTYKNYITDDDEKLSIVQESTVGVYAADFETVAGLSGYKKDDVASLLGISGKTFSRYKTSRQRFDAAQSEILLKLKALFTLGNEVFGNNVLLRRWLETPAYGLGGLIPQQIIKTSTGIDMVMNELTNIAYGNLA
jgi:putative toxin-antitoxin system antitoxin component (TIGR02293 family)